MNIIDPTNTANFAYVVLPKDFEIQDDAQIIFAPNGVGKTTLFKILKAQNDGKCDVYNYDSTEGIYKAIEGKKKKIEISPMSSNYNRENSIVQNSKAELSSDDIMKALYGTTTLSTIKKKAKNNPNFIEIAENGMITNFVPLDTTDREKLKYILDYPNELKKLLVRKDELISLTESDKLADLEILKYIDRKLIYNSYNIEKHEDDIKREGCPLCGRKDDNVYNDIIKIRQKIENAKFMFFENYTFLFGIPKNISKLDAINQTIAAITNLSDDKYISLLKTLGNKDSEDNLSKKLVEYNTANNNIKKYIIDRDNAYNNMLSSQSTIQKYFPLLYPNSSIEFDDKNKTIIISTPRNMETYSEGEKHEMYSIIKELTIIGSDKELVIADDPLTDLDVANEYKNVFRFIKLANDNKKKVIIFTCNPNFINIANEYHDSLFKRYYLTSHVDLTTGNLNMELMKMDFKQKKGAYICLEQICDQSSHDISSSVVNLINERTKLDISGSNPNRSNDISKILHYDSPSSVSINTINISNDQLFNAIDLFKALPKYTSFSSLAKDRVFYLASLRVYIEKKLYDYQQERITKGLSDCFPPKDNAHYLTKDKIVAVEKLNNSNDPFPISSKYPKWNKTSLMCLKTMLNDNDHPYSQILPLTYVLSISNDAFMIEIESIKEMFS